MEKEEKNIKIWAGEMDGYKLLDSGDKKKLEEIGGVKIVRDEPRAWWQKSLPETEWQISKDQIFGRTETVIDIGIGGIKAKIRFKSGSKHIGIFPEQFPQWRWIENKLKDPRIEKLKDGEIKILNLFGYTGIASLVAAQAGLSREASAKWGVKVTHVDASKQSVEWARENQKLSGLENAPIRWIVDDVIKFLKKELRRKGSSPDRMGGYDAIIMDPPQFGKGPKGEVWKIEEKLPILLNISRELLSDRPLFVILNMYSTELSSISATNLLRDMMGGLSGDVEASELAIPQQNSNRLLPMSISATWSAN